ncbi:protein BREAST CANCER SUSCEPTIBILITY 2 homolog A isoform X2 [Neltuma alba]|uniref:protein BREAST CANCER SUSCEPTIBILITY 2 homolog A isoform X2 n=1 Tax=Neltuma alba TaxID=207710 RepID=UPI0010A3012C|nr:protein BREAST CANCER SUSCEPTIBILITY 2 homolog A-like isoform X2 [Prosopis alba]
MSSWQMLSDHDGNFQWENSHFKPNAASIASSSPLPTMSDVLLQGCSVISENRSEGVKRTPTFRTGLGKPVSVNQSSIAKASSVLGEDAYAGAGKELAMDDDCHFPNSLFKTGTGKRVNISSNGLARAKTLLGLKEDATDCNSQSLQQATKLCDIGEAYELQHSSLAQLDKGVSSHGMMKGGSRLSPLSCSSPSSINKTKSIGGTGLDNYSAGKELAMDDDCLFSNSVFKTGSGKTVNISSNGLARAKTLLGLKEDASDCNSQSLWKTTKLCAIDEAYELQRSSQSELDKGVSSYGMVNMGSHLSPLSCFNPSSINNTNSVGGTHTIKNYPEKTPVRPEKYGSACKEGPVKFFTAGGRSLSVSNDALERARNLLGDPDLGGLFDEGDAGNAIFSFSKERQSDSAASYEENDPHTPLYHHITAKSKYMTQSFTSPMKSSGPTEYSSKFPSVGSGSNLITKFNAVGKEINCMQSSITCPQTPLHDKNQVSDKTVSTSSFNGFPSRMDPLGKSSQISVEISNTMSTAHATNRQLVCGTRRLGPRVNASTFKQPRNTRFSAPLKQDVPVSPDGSPKLSSSNSGCKKKVSTRYPFQNLRMDIREFFRRPLSEQKMLEHFPNQPRQVTSGNAEKYVLDDCSGVSTMGSETFFHILAQSGASTHYASKEWVTNHYKWIVWKLACYERCYPGRSAGKFLTTSNVLEELKYRYEREVNYGQRSMIKKILEGDASCSSMMILCISAIHPNQGPKIEAPFERKLGPESNEGIKLELTDGWYSITAILDVPLSKKLAAGKLFVGQKLRIWGAGLSGWTGPVSPLEVLTSVCLVLHINGTYRVHWAEKLGLCKHAGPPLAFRCIKDNGGAIPQTLVGVTRIYPFLYKERLNNGETVVRSEKMEANMIELYKQRCTAVIEGITSNLQEETQGLQIYDDGSEGAKIYNMLETAEDPEFLMADMSPEQLNSFVAYKAKLKATKQSNLEKSVEKALKDAGLGKRDVTEFVRVRVVGLIQKNRNDMPREGLITIWNPTENQRQELVEGQAYLIAGLAPSRSDSDVLHLQARGSSNKWLPLSSSASANFKPFFNCRKSISLSNLSDIPLSSEFDTAAYIVHVGEVYTSGHRKTQWIFVIDGSKSSAKFGQSISLLAICFCSQSTEYELTPPINHKLAGSTVGFCNLTKKEKDHINHIWVAEASENSTYHLTFDSPRCSHLRHSASSIKRWANNSCFTVGKVKERVLSVVGDCKR